MSSIGYRIFIDAGALGKKQRETKSTICWDSNDNATYFDLPEQAGPTGSRRLLPLLNPGLPENPPCLLALPFGCTLEGSYQHSLGARVFPACRLWEVHNINDFMETDSMPNLEDFW